ncbi:hypothetical protein KKF34_19075 [Myxococcota bacterium]|nr:hypothetical protein [Myxococcota bacterium]MBU1382842.1 hypothetical protein [Myxococcota bacterium]MBU1498991.1 hypothetical protein [Myxococcota bacterium]
MFKILIIISALIFSSCDDSPRVYGPTTFVVGQQVTVEMTKGSTLKENGFSIIDSSGQIFTSSNPLVEYEWIGKNEFSFRIPSGIASGKGVIKVEGSSEIYSLDLNLIRGLIWSDSVGTLTLSDMNLPANEVKTAQVGEGYNIIRIIDEQSRIVVLSPASGQIDYFTMDGEDQRSMGLFAPSLVLQSTTQGINAQPVDVIAIPSGLVIAADKGIAGIKVVNAGGTTTTFDSWIYSDGATRSLDISGEYINSEQDTVKLIAAAGVNAANESVIILFELRTFPRASTPKDVIVLSSDSNVSDVAVNEGGTHAAAVIPTENTLYLVNTSTQSVVPTNISDCSQPTAVEFVAGGEKIAILCSGSDSVQVYTVSGTTANHFKTISAGTTDNHVAGMFYAADGRVYVSLEKGGIVYFDASSSNPVLQELPNSSFIKSSSFVVQP